MLRSFRLGEADRVLHLYTLDRGRVGAVAKGVRKTKSRFGARLEPLSHVELMLHQGGGELQTVTGVELVALAPRRARGQPYRLGVGLVGAEAMLRLFPEQEANERALSGADAFPRPPRRARARRRPARRARPARSLVPAQAALALRLPAAPDELRRVRGGDRPRRLLAARPAARSARTARTARSRSRLRACRDRRRCSQRPLAEAAEAGSDRARARARRSA